MMNKRSVPAEHPETVQALIGSLARHGDIPAITAFREDGAETWSYKEFFAGISSLAAGLSKIMQHEGRMAAVCAGNGPQWMQAAMAVIYAGGVLLPVDRQADDDTLRHIFNDSGAGILFAAQDPARKIRRLDLAKQPRTYFLDSDVGEQSWRILTVQDPGDPVFVGPEDTAALFYTSGTTGPPKGVPLSHANLACQPAAIRAARLIVPNDRVLLPLPLHHVYPFVMGLLTPLALGLPVIVPASLTGREIIRAVKNSGVSIIIGVPRLYRTMFDGIRARIDGSGRAASILFSALLALSRYLRHHFGILPGRYLFPFIHNQLGPSLRVLASGGSALDAGLAEDLEGLGWQVAVGYGLTETSPLLTINPPGSGRLRSVGQAVKGVEIRIAEDVPSTGSESGPGRNDRAGEVVVRGPNVFCGYHHLEEKTEKAFTEDGWFRTGDLGYLDREGFLYLLGRATTVIVTASGKNLQPDEIEEFYSQHPSIGEIGVFLHDGRLTGIVVPDVHGINHGSDLEEIIRNAVTEQSGKLPSYKSLADYVVTREALPRTRLGKIRRHLLEDRYAAVKTENRADETQRGPMTLPEMSDGDQALLENENAEKIWTWLSARYPDRRLTPDSDPRFDLGIDSLEWLDVSLQVQQRTGIELSEETIGRIDTIRDLLEEVSNLTGSGESPDPQRPLREPESILDEDQKRWLQPLGPVHSLLGFTAYHINRTIMRGCFRLQVIGRENMPTDRQCLVTPNHVSALDPLAVAAALPYRTLRRTFFAGWAGIAFRNVLFRFVSRLARAVPVDSRHAVSSSLAFGSAVLGRGNNLIWFPEGRRSPDGNLQEFKPGISLLLEHHDIPVVPVLIKGSYTALPSGKIVPRFCTITVTIGKPVTREMLRQGATGEISRERIRHGLRKKVEDLQQAAAEHKSQDRGGI